MLDKIIQKILLLAATLFYAAQTVAAPSLTQTENYIKEQLLNGSDIINVEVSCNEINTKFYNMHHEPRAQSFSPHKVRYAKEVNEDSKEIITARCINSRCVSYYDQEGNPTLQGSRTTLDHAVTSEQFLNALNHHQSLCGGTESPLF